MDVSWVEELKASLLAIAEEIGDSEVRRVVIEVLEKPELSYSATTPLIKLEESPAAPRKHHFFTGGLLLHTLSVVRVADAVSRVIEEVYGIRVDRDLVIAAALLHDIYKYYQYARDELYGGYKMRDDWYLAHHYSVVGELVMRRAPERLIRVVSEVHGDTPFTTIEGLVVHLADSLDARLGEILQNTVLGRVRDLEATCHLYKALDKLIREKGPRELFSLLFTKPEELRRLLVEACTPTASGPGERREQ